MNEAWHEVQLDGFRLELPAAYQEVSVGPTAGGLRQFARSGSAIAVSAYRRRAPFTGSLGMEAAASSLAQAWREAGEVDERVLEDAPERWDIRLSCSVGDPSVARVVAVRLADGEVGVVELVRPANLADELGATVDRIAASVATSI